MKRVQIALLFLSFAWCVPNYCQVNEHPTAGGGDQPGIRTPTGTTGTGTSNGGSGVPGRGTDLTKTNFPASAPLKRHTGGAGGGSASRPSTVVVVDPHCLSSTQYRDTHPDCLLAVAREFNRVMRPMRRFDAWVSRTSRPLEMYSDRRMELRAMTSDEQTARSLLNQGNYAGAGQMFRKLSHELQGVDGVPQSSKRDVAGMIALSDGLKQMADGDMAQSSRTMGAAASTTVADGPVKILLLMDEALAEMKQQHLVTGINLFREALALNPTGDQRAEVEMDLGLAMHDHRDPDAMAMLDRAFADAANDSQRTRIQNAEAIARQEDRENS